MRRGFGDESLSAPRGRNAAPLLQTTPREVTERPSHNLMGLKKICEEAVRAMRVNGCLFVFLCVVATVWADTPIVKLYAWPLMYRDRSMRIDVAASLPSTLKQFNVSSNQTVTVQCMQPDCQYSIVRTNNANVRALILGNAFAAMLSTNLEKVHNRLIIVRSVVEEPFSPPPAFPPPVAPAFPPPVAPPASLPFSAVSPRSIINDTSHSKPLDTSHNIAVLGPLWGVVGFIGLVFACASCACTIRMHRRQAASRHRALTRLWRRGRIGDVTPSSASGPVSRALHRSSRVVRVHRNVGGKMATPSSSIRRTPRTK